MNSIKAIKGINERELEQGLSGKASWHNEYRDSAWIYAGGFPYDLTEGDVLCVMSQWGEVEDINLCRDKDTGKSKGFCFVKYEDQRSTILAVDNFNGIELLGRTLRVDHKHKYSLPAEVRERAEKLEQERMDRGEEPSTREPQWRPGVAYEGKQLANQHNFHKGVDVFAAPDEGSGSSDDGKGLESEVGRARGKESEAGKKERREAKRARKEARREARERKKQKKEEKKMKSGKGSAEGDRDHKKKKDHKREEEGGGKGGKRDGDAWNSHGVRRRDGNREGDQRRDSGGRADAAGAWERGARIAGGEFSRGYPDSAASRPAAPASLSIGNVMDWRGLGGGGGGRGRGGRSGRGGREGGRGGGRGGEGVNSIGGMDRRR